MRKLGTRIHVFTYSRIKGYVGYSGFEDTRNTWMVGEKWELGVFST